MPARHDQSRLRNVWQQTTHCLYGVVGTFVSTKLPYPNDRWRHGRDSLWLRKPIRPNTDRQLKDILRSKSNGRERPLPFLRSRPNEGVSMHASSQTLEEIER